MKTVCVNAVTEITSKSSLDKWKEITLCVTICVPKDRSSFLVVY